MIDRFIKVDQGHHVPLIYLFWVLYSNVCMKQRFVTSTTCENACRKLAAVILVAVVIIIMIV